MLKDLYANNKPFKEYIDRFSKQYGLTIEEAFKHKIVQDVAEMYKNKKES